MFDAGQVITKLGFATDPAKAREYESQVRKAAATGDAAEARLAAAHGRMASALSRTTVAQKQAEQAARASGLAHSQQAVAVAKNEAETAKLERTMRRSGVATKLQSAELEHLTRQHGVLSTALGNTTARTSLLAKHSDQAARNLGQLGNVGAKGAAIGLGTLAVATIYAAKTAGDFEKQMRNVNSIAKLSEADYHSLSRGVLELAGQTAQAPRVLAEGLYQLVSSGFNASDSLTILRSSAKAATAGLTDTATATTAVAAVLNAYRLPASQAGQVSDVLFETVNRGVLTFEELSKVIGDALPYAAALGVQLPEVGAAFSTMTKEGIPAAETATRVRRVIQSFIKPSKDMAGAIKDTGAASGETLVKQKGLQGAIEAVVKTTDGQKASIAKLFPDIRALGGVLALTGKNTRGANADLQAFQDTAGATQKVFNEQSKGAEFAGKRLFSSFQTAAIIVGNEFLPILAKGAGELTHILQAAANDGSLERLGHSILSFFGGIGQVGGNLAGPIEAVAKALVDVGKAAGLGNAAEVSALLAGFLAFKGATFVAPILAAIAGGITEIGLAAATAGSLTAFGADMVALAGGPIGALAIALGLAAGAFVAFESGLFSSASAAEKDAAALEKGKAAVEALHDATDKSVKSHFAVERAALRQRQAEEHLRQVQKEIHDGALKGADAQNQLKDAQLGVAEAVNGSTDASKQQAANLKAETETHRKALDTLGARQAATLKQIAGLEKENTALGTQHRTLANGEDAYKKLLGLRAQYNRQFREQQSLEAQVATSEESRRRGNAGKSPITAKNAQGVRELQQALGEAGASRKVTVRFELESQDAQAKLGRLAQTLSALGQQSVVAKVLTTAPSAGVAVLALQAILRGVPPVKVIRILHNAGSAKAAISQLHGAINAVPPSKTVSIATNAPAAKAAIESIQGAVSSLHGTQIGINILKTTTELVNKATGKHASGRGQGPAEAALVGEGAGQEYVIDSTTGQGFKTSGPTLLGLGPSDYVVPLEDRYRGRALGLFAMLARDLGIPGYKAGKSKGKGKSHVHHPVPNAIDPLSLPLTDIENKQQHAHAQYEKAASKVNSLTSQVHNAERTVKYSSAKTRPKAQARLHELQAQLRKAQHSRGYTTEHLKEQEWARTLKEAKAFQAKIDKQTQEVNIAGNAMKLADNRGDDAGYFAARGRRTTALGVLRGLFAEAQKHVKTGSPWFRELTEKIQGAEIEGEAAAGEEPQPDAEAPALTPDQVAEQKRIEAGIALAALTEGTADDLATSKQLVSFFVNALSTAQARGAGSEAIIELANSVKSARSTVEGLEHGSSENNDVQAQVTQEKERREVAERTAQIAEGALSVFGGAGDIGAGGPNARGAVVMNIQTLHQGDPALWHAVGELATKGIGLQGSVQATRVQVGPR